MKLSAWLRHWTWIPIAVFALLIGTSQGGGGVVGTGAVAFGALEGFGSIFVNGIEYFTDGASILIDGQPAAESDLRVGMRLRVDGVVFGSGSTGQASVVTYDPDVRGTLEGPVTLNTEGAFFTVGGIGIQADDATITDGVLAAAQLAAGDRVEVSGLRDEASGIFRALRIQRLDNAAGTVLTGNVSGVTGNSFNVGDVTVSFDGTVTGDATAVANGMVVRVKALGDPVGGFLVASEVRVLDGNLGVPAGTSVTAEGVVSGLGANSFFVGAILVTYDASTRFRNGTAADLANGAVVEVEGISAADGSVAAAKVKYPAPARGFLQAGVVSISANGFTLISDTGVSVLVDSGTRWTDRSAAKLAAMGLANVNLGDRVNVSGEEVAPGVISAASVTRLNPAQGLTLAGRARAAAGSTLDLLGQNAVASPQATFKDVDGTALAAGAFFAKAAGRTIKASGVQSDNGLLMSSFEIEP